MDPVIDYTFICGETSSIDLIASDADGDALSFEIVNDTLGFEWNGNVLSWNPELNEFGSYLLKAVVSDGSDSDTTQLKFTVYTQEQIQTSISFNSVLLYEEDNTYLILTNFLEENEQQIASLKKSAYKRRS